MITIFINENPIYLTDSLQHRSKTGFFRFDNTEIQRLIKRLETDEVKTLYLYDSDVRSLFKKFKGNFKIIKAAGGMVENLKSEILFIYRNGVWDLPKGKIEKGEKRMATALREVEEECGITNLELKEELERTYHIYKIGEQYILKITYWFRMSSNFQGTLQPQLEEGITKVEWLSNERMKEAMKNMYANIKLLLENAV